MPVIVRSEVIELLAGYLAGVSQSAHRQLGDVAGVAVTMASDVDGPITVGASTRLAREVDDFQFEIGRGPCLTALSGGGSRYVPDLGGSTMWGEYGPGAAARGARSCLSLPVSVEEDVLAVFKVYSAQVDGLDERQRRLAERVAVEMVGGLRLAQTLDVASLELGDRVDAMSTRRTIDLAVGILMERTGSDPDQAFALLRSFSQHRNTKLREVAADLVAERAGSDGRQSAGTAPRLAAPFRPRDGSARSTGLPS